MFTVVPFVNLLLSYQRMHDKWYWYIVNVPDELNTLCFLLEYQYHWYIISWFVVHRLLLSMCLLDKSPFSWFWIYGLICQQGCLWQVTRFVFFNIHISINYFTDTRLIINLTSVSSIRDSTVVLVLQQKQSQIKL